MADSWHSQSKPAAAAAAAAAGLANRPGCKVTKQTDVVWNVSNKFLDPLPPQLLVDCKRERAG